MKKRVLCSFLAIAMLTGIILTGCNGEKEATPEPAQESETELEEVPATENIEEDLVTDNSEEEIIEDIDSEEIGGRGDYISDCPTLEFGYEYPDVYDEDGNWIVEAYYPTINVFCDFDDYSAAAESVTASCNGYEHWVAESLEEIQALIDTGDEALSNLEKSQDMPLTSATVDVSPSRVDSKVISLFEYYYYFAGGAHPSYECGASNIDVATGKELSLEDVIKDMDGFESYALAKAKADAQEYADSDDIVYFDDIETAVADILSQKWYFDASGIEFCYNPGEIAPYACGILTFTMPYDELLSYMNNEYMPNTEDGFLAMPIDEECQATVISGMMVSAANENGYDGPGYISAGNTRKTIVEDGYIQEAYLFKRLQGIYIFANYYQNDRLFFSVYDVTDGDVKEIYSVSDEGFARNELSQDFITLCSSENAENYTEEAVNIDQIIPME